MPDSTLSSARVEVTANRHSGLTVRGVTKEMRGVQGAVKAAGLRWSPKQGLWYMPHSMGDGFNIEVETASRRLAHRIHAECGVEVRQLALVTNEKVQDSVTAAAPCSVPAIDPVHVRDHPDGGWVGSRYETTKDLQPAAVTALIRDDIKKAKRLGLLPAKLDVSVTKSSHSGGWSIRIAVKHWVTPYRYEDPATDRTWIDPTTQNILNNLQDIATQYNRRHDDSMTDFFSGRFHLSVTMDWETCNQQVVLASPQHPSFAKPAYGRS